MSSATSWATIEFPVTAIDENIKAILENEDVKFEGLLPIPHDDEPRVEVEDGIFNLHGEANYGEFCDLEAELVAKNIPFDRETGMDWSISPHLRVFRPGPPVFDHRYPKDEDGAVVVSVEAIQEIVDAYSSDETRGQLYGALTYYLSVNFPTYPPLTDWVKEG